MRYINPECIILNADDSDGPLKFNMSVKSGGIAIIELMQDQVDKLTELNEEHGIVGLEWDGDTIGVILKEANGEK